jgi:hypothetical protein
MKANKFYVIGLLDDATVSKNHLFNFYNYYFIIQI